MAEKIIVNLSSEEIKVTVPDINYIPAYKVAEEQRRTNELERIANEKERINYYQLMQEKVNKGEFDGKEGKQGERGFSTFHTVGYISTPDELIQQGIKRSDVQYPAGYEPIVGDLLISSHKNSNGRMDIINTLDSNVISYSYFSDVRGEAGPEGPRGETPDLTGYKVIVGEYDVCRVSKGQVNQIYLKGKNRYIFENALPTIFKNNKAAVKEFTNTIKEDKNLRKQFQFYKALETYTTSLNSRDYLNESLNLVKETIDKKTLEKSNKKLGEIIKKYI